MGFRAGVNFYTSVGGSPINFVDPSGLDRGNPFVCAASNASKVSAASMLTLVGVPDFPGDAVGGNPFSDATDLVQSFVTGSSGQGPNTHSVFYNLGEEMIAGPTQGFSPVIKALASAGGGQAGADAFEESLWSEGLGDVASDALNSALEKMLNEGTMTSLFETTSLAGFDAAEYASGIGEAKFVYDALTYLGSMGLCETGFLH